MCAQLIMDYRWTTSFDGSATAATMHYSFPTQASDYTEVAGYPAATQASTFQPLDAAQKAAVVTAFDLVTSYTGVTFVQVASGLASDATFRFADFNDPEGGSESAFPPNKGTYSDSDSRNAGDTWLGTNGKVPVNYFGTDGFNTIIHELGHAFGLKHGHDAILQRRARGAIQRQRILGDDLRELSRRQHRGRHGGCGTAPRRRAT